MPVINTNINSIVSQNATNRSDRAMTTTMEKLSTGYRINKSGDDAAGLAVSTKMTSQIRGTYQAARNISDAVAMVQTADGALREVSSIMQRMRELAVQGSTETYSPADLLLMDTEYQQLEAEITRIVDQTKWNKMDLLNGDGPGDSAGQGGVFVIQVGADKDMDITYTTPDMDNLDVISTSASKLILSQNSASATITTVDDDIATVNTSRATAGAFLTRFEGALDNALEMAQNLTDTRSRILDTDYAMELAELAKFQIMQQAVNAMMAQANSTPQSVLAMLS